MRVPPGSLVAGVPAKVRRELTDEEREHGRRTPTERRAATTARRGGAGRPECRTIESVHSAAGQARLGRLGAVPAVAAGPPGCSSPAGLLRRLLITSIEVTPISTAGPGPARRTA